MSAESEITAAITAIMQLLVDNGDLAKAVDPPPAQIDTVHLPCNYTYTGEADYTDYQENVIWISRTFRNQTAVLPYGQSTPQLREAKVRPVLEVVRDQLFSYSGNLGALDLGLMQVRITRDSGVAMLPDWDGKFIGFEFTMIIEYVVARTYEDDP